MNKISIGEKDRRSTFVEMKVVPQINMVMNAARCPVNVLFFIIILPCCRKLSSYISKNPLILFRRQADKLLKKLVKWL